MYLLLLVTWVLLFGHCSTPSRTIQEYQDQIGDTPFDPSRDNPEYTLCDSTNVLHKRAYIQYTGGIKAMEEELFANYEYQPSYSTFSGTFIIRFVVNCRNEAGRYRMQILDEKFQKTTAPKNLVTHILSISKNLNKWNHAVYKGKDHDGYRFITIKMENGQLIKK